MTSEQEEMLRKVIIYLEQSVLPSRKRINELFIKREQVYATPTQNKN